MVAIINAARFILPELSFIGGESQELVFRLFLQNREPLDASNIECEMSVVAYGNYITEPIVKKIGTSVIGNKNISYAKITLDAADTVGLSGKFIYQISLKDKLGNVELFQGIMLIFGNTHCDFILQTQFH